MAFRILMVEDSATQAESLRVLLEEEGYVPTVARSGEEALERISGADFDLVLSDVMMPGIDGYELCRRIKVDLERRDLPVVLLTSLTDPMDIVRGLEAGADNYITKPYEPDLLVARIRRVLDNRDLRHRTKTSMGVNIAFLGTTFTITSDKEQILDLLLSSVEDIVRANQALAEQQNALAEAHAQLEAYAREKTREARFSTERYRALMLNAGDAVFLLDVRGRIVETNPRAAELLGRGEEEISGRAIDSFMAAEEAGRVRAAMARAASSGAAMLNEETLLRPDGTSVTLEISVSRTNVDGETFVLVIARDVTERRAAEERLRQSERQLAEAQRMAGIGSWELDLTSDLLDCSDECNRIFRTDFRRLGHRWRGTWEDRIHPDDRDRVCAALEDAVAGGPVFDVEYRVVYEEDERIVQARGDLIRDESGAPLRMVGTVQDVTERRKADENLRRSEERLQHAQRMEAVGRLAGGIAHDFNNVLTAIRGGTQLLLMDVPEQDPIHAELLEIDRAAVRAAGLTRQLLAFSRKQVVRPRVLNLNELVQEIDRMLRRMLGEDVHLDTRPSPSPLHVLADPSQLEQVVVNLAVNARDAMPRGGPLGIETGEEAIDPVRGQELDLDPGSYVTLSVRDAGSGIEPDVMDHIFEPFFTTKPAGQGTGLGLATVYGIAKQNGGAVAVESEIGRGSTFTVYLPLAQQETEEAADSLSRGAAPTGTETVLLAEDEESVRRLAGRVLRRQGYNVLEARSGEDALELARMYTQPINLLVTDVVMPGMSGRTLAGRLSHKRPGLRVLYMSGYTDDAMVRHGVLEPGINLVEKPFSPEELARRVREALS